MPTFEITAPDGRVFQVDGPEGATEQDALNQVQAQLAQPREPVSRGQAALIGGGAGLDAAAAGLRALAPDALRKAIDTLNSSFGFGPVPSINPAERAAAEQAIQPVKQQYPLTTALAEGAPSLAAKTPLGMAGMAALNYGTPEQRALAGGSAFVGGKIGEGAANLLGRAIQPVRATTADAMQSARDLFDKYGLTALPSQITGSRPLAWLESTLANLPGGGRVRSIVGEQQQGLNRAALNAIGAEGSALTPEVAQGALQATGQSIGNLTGGVPKIAIDDTLKGALNDVADRYGNKLDTLQRPMVEKLIADIKAQGDSMSGEFYQQTRSDISSMANAAGGTYKNALQGIYKALDRAFDRSAPQDVAEAVKAARTQYRTGKVLAPMATATGDISPRRLATAAKNMPAENADLSSLAAHIHGLPDSGTMQRLVYHGLLSGGIGAGASMISGDPMDAAKYGATAFAAPWLASQALTRAPIRNYLMNDLLTKYPAFETALFRSGQGIGGLLGQATVR